MKSGKGSAADMKIFIAWLVTLLSGRPHFTVGEGERLYLSRWYLTPWSAYRGTDGEPKSRLWSLYLHRFTRSDDDRAMHDHPWWFISLVLRGRYFEFQLDQPPLTRRPGSIAFRRAEAAHRVELIDGKPCWTLILTGRRVRMWGFHCPNGWVEWRRFVAGSRGCGE